LRQRNYIFFVLLVYNNYADIDNRGAKAISSLVFVFFVFFFEEEEEEAVRACQPKFQK
jgi:hypothetical protein